LELGQHWFSNKGLLQRIESFLLFCCPSKADITCEPYKRSDNLTKVLDKASVEVGESKEAPYSFDCSWRFPFANSLDLLRIHTSTLPCFNNKAKILGGLDLKLAFLDIYI
jgi:hypothetical protein